MGFQDGVDYLLRALHHLLNDLAEAISIAFLWATAMPSSLESTS